MKSIPDNELKSIVGLPPKEGSQHVRNAIEDFKQAIELSEKL